MDTEGGDRGSGPLWQITSGYRFPKKYWYRPLESNCLTREVCVALCEIL